MHADKHMLKFRYNGDLYECNDGGVYSTRNNGDTWKDKSNGIVNSQMYKLGVSQTDPGDVITGLQDNGSKLISNGQWYDVNGGDGMECMIDHSDANIQYSTVYYGSLSRTMDHWENSEDVTPYEAGNGAWITPYVIDPVDPNILLGGFADVWITHDRGSLWEPISFLTTSIYNAILR